MKRAAIWGILILSFVGLSDSFYLATEETDSLPLLCNLSGLSDCNAVAQSTYSHVFGIPVAYLGVAFFLILFAGAIAELLFIKKNVRRGIQFLVVIGLIASAYFVFVQFAIIHALCVYCLISAGIAFLVFILAYFIEPFSDAIPLEPPHSRTTLTLPPPNV